jgi:hypothetical protein
MDMDMDKDKFESYKQDLEKEFDEVIERGGNVSYFLYFPYHHLTLKMKDYLDDLLMEEAYRQIALGNLHKTDFVVYKDSLITVSLDTQEKQLEILNKMLEFFTNKEEYEKCSDIHQLIKTIE